MVLLEPCRKLLVLWNRPDFRSNPLRAVARRVWWRSRWWCTDRPWELKLSNDLALLAPRTGSAALLYYQGTSEPGTAGLISRYLRTGMIFLDVGAHIGEYTLRASTAVGVGGQVHSFEPDPTVFQTLSANVRRNRALNVKLNKIAISQRDGTANFLARSDASLSSLATREVRSDIVAGCALRTPTRSLDSYCRQNSIIPHLVKADVEGAELLLLKGAARLLSLPVPTAPAFVIEYTQKTYERFHATWLQLQDIFRSFHYYSFFISDTSHLEPVSRQTQPPKSPCNLFASKRLTDCDGYTDLKCARTALGS
jgi:FkbM family methyltransferase